MKRSLLIVILCLHCLPCFSLPVDESSREIWAGLSLDILAVVNPTAQSAWYGTTMPGYRLGYREYRLTDEDQLHFFSFALKYFGSNRFQINSLELPQGTVSLQTLSAQGQYLGYLPITKDFDFLTGADLQLHYREFGRIVSSDGNYILSNTYLELGPVMGFSLQFLQELEFRSLVTLAVGLPIQGEQQWPDGTHEEIYNMNAAFSFDEALTYRYRAFQFTLGYQWSMDFFMLSESPLDTAPLQDTFQEQSHAVEFQVGYSL